MKKPLFSTLVILFLCAHLTNAQSKESETKPAEPKTPAFGIHFSGYVNSDLFFDTRQTVMARDGQWLFYPENIRPDAEGVDINAKGAYNILSIQTRISGNITGPDIFGAKTSGLIEGEFYGSANASINSLRLRHAYVRLTWAKAELQLGQYWHPMFVPLCAPEVASLNTGAPFLVFSRNPQIRFARHLGRFKIILTALAQLDATSTGPDGPSSKYLRNSMIPEGNIQIQYGYKNDDNQTEFMIGASADYLILTPRLSTEVVEKEAYDVVTSTGVTHYDAVVSTYETDAKSPALTVNFFTKLKLPRVTMKLGAVYGQDCYAFNMIGGYAVKEVTNPQKGTVSYTPIATGSVWGEFRTNGNRWQPGIFGGFSKNLGAGTNIAGPFYSRGSNIDYLYRVAPRLNLMVKKMRIAGEVDYTVAAYGNTTGNGLVSDSKEVGNIRFLLGVYYYF